MPPTATYPPTPTATPIAESRFDGVRVTFVYNTGFLITVGDKRILIDVLYEGYAGGVLKPVLDSQPPFDGVDLILATHEHHDHFSPDLVLRYMQDNPHAVFISTQSAVEQLVALDDGIQDRALPIELGRGESEQIDLDGFTLEAIYLSHGIPGLLNLGFIVEIGDVVLLHTGDADPDSVSVSDLQSYSLPERQIDVAFVPDFWLTMEEYHPLATEGIQARYLIPMHFSLQSPPVISEAVFPNAFVFQETYQSWVLPSTDGTSPVTTPTPPAIVTQVREKDHSVMVYVPGGTFQMGSDDAEVDAALDLCTSYYSSSCVREWFEVEQPIHTVTLDGFWIDQTEITNGRYRQCVEAGICEPPRAFGSATRATYYGDEAYDTYPVIHVDWYQAQNYCEWVGGRLPTEAEWEYAARGPDGLRYPWGDEYDGARLNSCDVTCGYDWADRAFDDGYADTAPVGSYPQGASWCGALNMAGNVWEWTGDRFGEYPQEPQINPTGPSSGTEYALRGDAADGTRSVSRCAARHGMSARRTYGYTGFRCVYIGPLP